MKKRVHTSRAERDLTVDGVSKLHNEGVTLKVAAKTAKVKRSSSALAAKKHHPIESGNNFSSFLIKNRMGGESVAMKHRAALSLLTLSVALIVGCSGTPMKQPPLKTVARVDLPRFMGPWFVIGTIPWIVERHNVGTMDIYRQRPDGRIDITYVFHKKELTAKRQEMHAIGTVINKTSNATWGVQFLWPFQAPYLIIDLAPDYRYTVIGYPSRDLLWIMSRHPSMSESDYRQILYRISAQGYETGRIVKVPQTPPAQ